MMVETTFNEKLLWGAKRGKLGSWEAGTKREGGEAKFFL
jgi:hypothetical protein